MNNLFKKYLYKFINKKKYKIYQDKQNELNNFKVHLEKDINQIQRDIKNKKELNFLHSGTSGDVINALPVIKELSKTHVCRLYIGVEKPIKKVRPNNFSRYLIPNKTYQMLMPLLKTQNYLTEVKKFTDQKIDINFDMFRNFPMSLQFDNLRYYFHITGIHADVLSPYLNVNEHEKLKNKIVIHRALRYTNHLINYKFLEKFNDLIFIGIMDEYKDLKKNVNNLEFHDCKDFHEMAMIIKSCRFFIGSSSIGHAIAEGLKVPRILEASPEFPAAYPHGDEAYDFYFQNHFEKLCFYLDNKYKKNK